ncbi:MAG: hypothetical protein HYX67_05550 [Candidatus Melainabacteria bacterium]|nr:hypothetical protein [Candidatus Melainabacteria bacterium]
MNFRSMLMTIAVSAVTCSSAGAATKPLDKDFLDFWSGFKGALQKNDKAAIASMTKLPYLVEEKKLDRAAFIAQSGKIFTTAIRKCLLREKPIADKDSVFVFCGDEIYVFAKDQGKYKFIEIGVND